MTTTHDMAALLAAVDAGDDGALPYLADCLEEMGDPRATGLRRALTRSPAGPYQPTRRLRPNGTLVPGMWAWTDWNAVVDDCVYGNCIRLPGGHLSMNQRPYGLGPNSVRAYPTRSAAYLALAEALSQEAQ